MIIVSDRKLLIPSGEKHIGFAGDNMVEERVFVISNNKIFDLDYRIDLGNTGETAILEKRISSDGKLLFLSWNITASVLKNTPSVEFQLRGFEADGERVWHSEKNSFYTDASIDASCELTEEELDEFHVIEKQVAQYFNEVKTLRDEAQAFRNEAQDMAQQSLADYSELKESVYTKSETAEKIKNDIESVIVQEMGNDATKVVSQKCLTEGLTAYSTAIDEQIGALDKGKADTEDVEDVKTKVAYLEFGMLGKADSDHVHTAEDVGAYSKDEVDSKIGFEIDGVSQYAKGLFDEVDTKIGDIDSALDELHSYAQALIGGEE